MDAVAGFEMINGTRPVPLAAPAAKEAFSPLLIAFLTLQIAGAHILLPFLLCSFWFTSAKRNITLINLFVCFVVTGIVMCLLFYSGQYAEATPDPGWCQAQASLSFAVAPMDGTAVLCLLWHVWNQLRLAHGGKEYTSRVALFAVRLPAFAPYIVGLGFACGGISEAVRDANHVKLRSNVQFFCTLPDGPYSWTTTVFTAGSLIISMFFIAGISWKLLRSLRASRRISTSAPVPMDIAFISRVVLYGGYVVVGLVLTAISVFFPTPVPDMFCATIPLFIGTLFGSQKDIWQAWRRLLMGGSPVDEKDSWQQV